MYCINPDSWCELCELQEECYKEDAEKKSKIHFESMGKALANMR